MRFSKIGGACTPVELKRRSAGYFRPAAFSQPPGLASCARGLGQGVMIRIGRERVKQFLVPDPSMARRGVPLLVKPSFSGAWADDGRAIALLPAPEQQKAVETDGMSAEHRVRSRHLPTVDRNGAGQQEVAGFPSRRGEPDPSEQFC